MSRINRRTHCSVGRILASLSVVIATGSIVGCAGHMTLSHEVESHKAVTPSFSPRRKRRQSISKIATPATTPISTLLNSRTRSEQRDMQSLIIPTKLSTSSRAR